MSDLLESGSTWLKTTFASYVAQTVTYRRDQDSVVITKATIGETRQQIEFGVFVNERTNNRDILIQADDLVLSAVKVQPQAGDTLEQVADGKTYTYEVMDLPGGGAWEWHDVYYHTYRIHTTLTSVV